jgi:hypothetical protein
MHSDLPKAPFPLDASNRTGGEGEPGWAGPWLAHPKATFQSKVVFEGDGALYLQGSPNFGPNYGRQLARAQAGKFQVEHRVQVPAGSNFGAYVWQQPRGADFSGPNWGVRDGWFGVYGRGNTGIKCVPGQWYKVTVRIDVEKHTWEFFVDDKRFETPEPLKFRGKVPYLDYINFLVEGGVYFDDLRVTGPPGSQKEAPKPSPPALGPVVGSKPKPSPKAGFRILSAEELTKAFLDNEAAARKKYGGLAPVAVQGVVKLVHVDKKGEVILYLKGAANRLGVACTFEAKESKEAAKVKVGDQVLVAGAGYGVVAGDVLLGFCRLLPAAGNPNPAGKRDAAKD